MKYFLEISNWICSIARKAIYINIVNWATMHVQYHDLKAFANNYLISIGFVQLRVRKLRASYINPLWKIIHRKIKFSFETFNLLYLTFLIFLLSILYRRIEIDDREEYNINKDNLKISCSISNQDH